VSLRVDDDRLSRKHVRAKLMVGMRVSGGCVNGSRGTVVQAVASLERAGGVLWTPQASCPVHPRWEPRPRVMKLRSEVMSDCQHLISLIPNFCPGGQRQKLTVNNSILLV